EAVGFELLLSEVAGFELLLLEVVVLLLEVVGFGLLLLEVASFELLPLLLLLAFWAASASAAFFLARFSALVFLPRSIDSA
ncbi:hypothetical protein Q0P46_14190, partial [Staphylococcus aureus]|nr:hypothetical protein [Staphylococcus aureus]